MERINLTPQDIRTIPVTINGTDHDLSFNIDDIRTTTAILDMADTIVRYQAAGEELKDAGGDNVSRISRMKEFAQNVLDLCRRCSRLMAGVVMEWEEIVGDNFIGLPVYEALIMAMATIVKERQVKDSVEEQVRAER